MTRNSHRTQVPFHAAGGRGMLAGLLVSGLLGHVGPSRASEAPTPTPASSGLWSVQPLRRTVLDPSAPLSPARIDALLGGEGIRSGLAAETVPEAHRRALARRVTYDLTGLPPKPEDVDAFVADGSAEAYGRFVDRLLDSPQYGERWGRHWLDVVRYADTAGENTDHPLPQAWRYRNWVIRALNEDRPYDEFLRDQIAGDLIASPDRPTEYADRVVATGYLALARRFGHDIDQDVHLTFEDAIDNLGKSVLGLTLGCARCHDHKYDPVSTRDYYGLYGILASTRFAFPGCEPRQQPRDLVPLLPPAEVARLREPFQAELARREAVARSADERLAGFRKEFDASLPVPIGAGELSSSGLQDFSVGDTEVPASLLSVRRGEMLQLAVGPRANHGADSTGVEWIITEQGGSNQVWSLAREVVPEFERANLGGRGVWWFYDLSAAPTLFDRFDRGPHATPDLLAWRGAGDGVPSAFVNSGANPIHFLTVTMPPRSFGLHPGPKGAAAVAWASPIDGKVVVRLRLRKLDPGGDGVTWKLERRPGLGRWLAEAPRVADAATEAKRKVGEWTAQAPDIPLAYAVVDGSATNVHVQKRGDPAQPGPVVPRKFLDLLGGQTVTNSTGSGRLELARWLTNPTNALTSRVMVNRIWLGHFGRGLVSTPNDFGTRGQAPSHPELLDALAAEFIRGGWRLKAMHRLILRTDAYRRSSLDAQALAQASTASSSGNGGGGAMRAPDPYRYFARRRLGAEELRDSLLAASGELDPTAGGAHPFPKESTWNFTQHGPFGAEYETTKRSVYVMQKRNRRTPFFALFDGPDPNASTPVRDLTTVPTQALFFLNDPFFHARAAAFARRVLAAGSDETVRLDFAYRQLFCRRPGPEERAEANLFRREFGAIASGGTAAEAEAAAWAAYSRVLLSSSEFLHLD